MFLRNFWLKAFACVLAVVIIAAGIAGVVIYHFGSTATLKITLTGLRELMHQCGSEFVEPGATAQFSGGVFGNKSVPVTVEGTVDETTLGTYMIKYVATYNGQVGTAYRWVHVVDTEPPTIKLVTDPNGYTFPNATYIEEGFSATDNCDGDVTAMVQRTETRDKVTYTVTDSSGNTATVWRKIVYDDPVAPELSLAGEKFRAVAQGRDFTEPGYTASDNCDGDITARVQVSGQVDTSRAGNYLLTYTVRDSYDNETSVNRMVMVYKKGAFVPKNILVPDGKVIYLTFDDGPSKHTERLLEVLKRYDVKATFFVAKTGYVNMISQIAADGHSIGIHTTTHNFKQIYKSTTAYFDDLYTIQGIIKEKTGIETKLLRFPGGSSNTVSRFNRGIMTKLAKMVQEKGFRYFDWNVDSNDAGGAENTSEVIYNVMEGVSKKQIAVVLQHDTKGFSVDAVEQIIIWGQSNGYQFLPLDMTSPICHHSIRN